MRALAAHELSAARASRGARRGRGHAGRRQGPSRRRRRHGADGGPFGGRGSACDEKSAQKRLADTWSFQHGAFA
eukprot:3518963-Pyramimonas_sp.AAC.1